MERTDFDQWKAREVARLLALVESERRYYQEMVATLPIPLVVLSADRSAISANRAFRKTFHLRAGDLRRHNIDQLLPIPELAARIDEAHAQEAPAAPLTAQWGERTVRISVVPIRDWNDENAVETLLMVEDLSGAPAVPVIVASATPADLPAVVWQADAETLQFRSVTVSKPGSEGAPVDELLGFPAIHWTSHAGFFEERIHAQDREAVMDLYRTAIDSGGEATAEFRAVSANGGLVWCRESIRAAPNRSITGVIAQIGRRKELERLSLTAARTEALQALTARLAHDLNNPLMIITGYAEEMLASLAADDPRRADLSQILTASGRVGEVTNQLIEFGRKHAHPAVPVNLTQALQTLEPSIILAAGPGVSVKLIAPEAELWACADATQLAEVILAMAGPHVGSPNRTRLKVSWHADTVSESIAGATLPPGRYSRVTLRDNELNPGPGTALFESVLAAKDGSASGGTSGSMLSRAYRTVREWGGDIAIENEPLSGHTYSLYLPYADPPAVPVQVPPEVPAAQAQVPAPAPEQLRETILVVDDEPGIRGLMRKILRRERYMVLEAGSAEEALAVALSHAGPIDLLLTDVMMPGLTGPELAHRLSDTAPNLKVLYISGHASEEALQPLRLAPGFAFLAKPFTLGALVSKVRETLDSPGT